MAKTVGAIPSTTMGSTETVDLDRNVVSSVSSPLPASDLSGFKLLHCNNENDLMCKYFVLNIY